MSTEEVSHFGVGTEGCNPIDLNVMFRCSSKALDLWQVNVMIHMILTKSNLFQDKKSPIYKALEKDEFNAGLFDYPEEYFSYFSSVFKFKEHERLRFDEMLNYPAF